VLVLAASLKDRVCPGTVALTKKPCPLAIILLAEPEPDDMPGFMDVVVSATEEILAFGI
jgi:hypothetical protein